MQSLVRGWRHVHMIAVECVKKPLYEAPTVLEAYKGVILQQVRAQTRPSLLFYCQEARWQATSSAWWQLAVPEDFQVLLHHVVWNESCLDLGYMLHFTSFSK